MERRNFLTFAASAAVGIGTATKSAAAETKAPTDATGSALRYQKGVSPWPICLDTATIRPATLDDKVKFAAEAGYDAIEPWDRELEAYEKEGGNLKDLGKKIKDLGLFVPSMIGLWNALPPTQEAFDASLVDTRRRMRMAADVGCEHVQVIGNTAGEDWDQKWVAARYRDLIEIGINEFNLRPALVFVKFQPIKTFGQAMGIALDSNHPKAMVIPDTFHMHISGGGFEALKHLKGDNIAIIQFADAPAAPVIDEMKDADRVYPGDGVLPLPAILKDLKATGFKGCVSLELYNPKYWEQDHLTVAKTGLEKTVEVIRKAGV
ncbi:sugar phosphate isomerase/epimerase [Phragmitibacter flavus]|uniref:Sugar phosphate isomerase/epimerase n=1 Tax=Phragmitibacter flavus TaxID=2576071 RepID=A0A5R8KI61_9BACT|nr:sugar phosphate isomerase/epimerase family protein [Phragmitibacter flavus]TLD72006.1 sugar phosphate isomerase/epimerase [Phragmitibacter flavus]